MQFGIFSVGDVTTDPATGRTPTDNERIRATVEIARLADDVGLGRRIDEAVGELRSCLTGVERRHPVDGFEQVIPFEELLKRGQQERLRVDPTAPGGQENGRGNDETPGRV